MSGYIYTQYKGADPTRGWIYSDPIFGTPPTLGACLPNIRRSIEEGDWFFSISGRAPGVAQFVVGGFRVIEKISHLAAYGRFPQYRLQQDQGGQVHGNVIVDAHGEHHPHDTHENFERRIENYLVGADPIFLSRPEQVERGRSETLPFLQRMFGREGNRVYDVVGRGRKMTDEQVEEMKHWLQGIAG